VIKLILLPGVFFKVLKGDVPKSLIPLLMMLLYHMNRNYAILSHFPMNKIKMIWIVYLIFSSFTRNLKIELNILQLKSSLINHGNVVRDHLLESVRLTVDKELLYTSILISSLEDRGLIIFSQILSKNPILY
jgi:hypothetical protein